VKSTAWAPALRARNQAVSQGCRPRSFSRNTKERYAQGFSVFSELQERLWPSVAGYVGEPSWGVAPLSRFEPRWPRPAERQANQKRSSWRWPSRRGEWKLSNCGGGLHRIQRLIGRHQSSWRWCSSIRRLRASRAARPTVAAGARRTGAGGGPDALDNRSGHG